jgi:hypothetical protein
MLRPALILSNALTIRSFTGALSDPYRFSGLFSATLGVSRFMCTGSPE